MPATSLRPYHERGVASWYGRKFHGQKTSSGETYDMYAMTAAHPTLPLPSYARVTNVATGKSVVVRVNDRGPFLHDRVIDLSYAAAHRIGIAQKGSGEVEVEAILPGDAPIAGGGAAAAGGRRVAAPRPRRRAPSRPACRCPWRRATAASSCSWVRSRTTPMRRISSRTCEPTGGDRGSNRRSAQVNGLFRVFVGPYPDARRSAAHVATGCARRFGLARRSPSH